MKWLKAQWDRLPPVWQAHVVSFVHTFVATLAVFVAAQLSQGDFSFTKDAVAALAAGAARAALKAAWAAAVAPKPPQQ